MSDECTHENMRHVYYTQRMLTLTWIYTAGGQHARKLAVVREAFSAFDAHQQPLSQVHYQLSWQAHTTRCF